MSARITAAAGVALLAGWAGWGQSAPPLSFEVASVKPAAPCCAPGQWRESKAGVDRIDFPNSTLKSCIAFAYGVKEHQISGPSWLGGLRYDILAKGPEGTQHDQLPGMMQALLAERFKLQAHRETRDFNVIALTVGKGGPKLTESAPGAGQEGAKIGMSTDAAGVGRMVVKEGNMTALANTLSRMLGVPVVDTTGLKGRYDFELEFSPHDSGAMIPVLSAPGGAPVPASEPGVSIFSSIQQVGLKLIAQKVAMDAIVVDNAEKTPTEN